MTESLTGPGLLAAVFSWSAVLALSVCMLSGAVWFAAAALRGIRK